MNPIKFTIKTEIFPVLLVLLCAVASFYFYSIFPEQVPIHWNMAGEVDNYASKAIGAFLFPVIILGVYLLFLSLPYLDPKKDRYEQFSKVYHTFKFLIVFYLAIIYFLTGLVAIGFDIQIGTWIPVMVGSLFMVIGNYMGKIKTNWFMGIRSPWTLSSENVWNKTHRLGGKLFMLAGLILIFMPAIPLNLKMPLFIGAIVIAAILPFIYSYILFHKEQKQKHENN